MRSQRAHALRAQAIADVFKSLYELRVSLASGMIRKSMVAVCEEAREQYVGKLALIEKLAPSWLVPSFLQAMSAMVAFLDGFIESLRENAGRKRASCLSWAGELPPFRTAEGASENA